MNEQVIEPQKKRINIAKDWLMFLYALLPLGDGQHVLIIQKSGGRIVEWRAAEVGKVQRPQ